VNIIHSPGTDAAAAASAAFSSCSAVYAGRGFNGSFTGPATLQNSSYAATLLTHSQQLHSFAVNATGGQKTYQTSVPAVAASYPSSSYTDDLTLSALFLSWAENSTARFQEAERYYQQYQLAGQNGVFNWDSKTPGLSVLFAQISQSPTGIGNNLSSWQTEAERYFDRIVNQQGPSYLTPGEDNSLCKCLFCFLIFLPGGLLYYDGDSDDASLNPALNAAMLLRRYAPMATSSDKKSLYVVSKNAVVLSCATSHVLVEFF
jgi:endoglucanase